MKKIFKIICFSILFTSCASTTQYVKYSGNEPNNETNAKIYVIRSTNFGSAIKMRIYQDDVLIESVN